MRLPYVSKVNFVKLSGEKIVDYIRQAPETVGAFFDLGQYLTSTSYQRSDVKRSRNGQFYRFTSPYIRKAII